MPVLQLLRRLVFAASAGMFVLLSQAAAAAACGSAGYTYAGVASAQQDFGISTRITALSSPFVEYGHVAGWIGVGGPRQGPGGTDEWLQVGYSAFPGSFTSNVYFEVARPGSAPQYTEVASAVPVGVTMRMAVLEMAHRHNWWRVWLNGSPVSRPIYLPGSHGAWRPMATAESWGGGQLACNAYRYAFQRVSVAHAAGGGWHPLTASYSFHSHDYAVIRRTRASFIATANPDAMNQARAAASASVSP